MALSDENVVRFPRPPLPESSAPLRADGIRQTCCDGQLHVFASRPGRCQCGSEVWNDEPPADGSAYWNGAAYGETGQ